MVVLPLCLRCKRFRGVLADVGYVCEAFGEKSIPPDILANAADHRFAYRGDSGLRFEPAETGEILDRNLDLISLAVGRMFSGA